MGTPYDPVRLTDIDASEDVDVTIVLVAANLIFSGVVLDRDGAPVASQQVTLSADPIYKYAETDEEGEFSMYVSAGTYSLSVEGWWYHGVSAVPQRYWLGKATALDIAEDTSLNITLQNRYITGKVVDPDGNPVADVSISAWADTWGDTSFFNDFYVDFSSWATSDDDGNFTLAVFSCESLNLRADPPMGTPYDPVRLTDIDASKDVTVIIALVGYHEKYNLTVSSTAGGSVTEPGEGTFAYDAGTVVGLVAEAEEGYLFINWSGNADTIANVIAANTTITMQDDCEITALFAAVLDSKTETVTDDTVDAKGEADTEVMVAGNATVTVARFADNPGPDPPARFSSLGKYIDVYVPDTDDVTEIEIRLYYTSDEVAAADLSEESLRLFWWDGTDWVECSDSGVNTDDTNGYSGYIRPRITEDTSPNLAQLIGTPFAGFGPAHPAEIVGQARQVNCAFLPGVSIALRQNGMAIASATSDSDGHYVLPVPQFGQYTLVASKEGFRDEEQAISVTESTTYNTAFVGDYGLIPNSPSTSYVLSCINLWQFGELPCKLAMSRVLAVINAWQFPV